jgi:hypothetical protein
MTFQRELAADRTAAATTVSPNVQRSGLDRQIVIRTRAGEDTAPDSATVTCLGSTSMAPTIAEAARINVAPSGPAATEIHTTTAGPSVPLTP